MVEMIPNLISTQIKSNAEADLFRKFRDYRTKENYIILHSLGISEHVNNIFGEIDFVIICEKGILCVEVKGGAVSCNQGIWEFTNRYGKASRKTEGPFKQVQGNMQSLRNHIKKRLGNRNAITTCQYASCVIMPDCRFEYNGTEIIPEILFDKNDDINLDYITEKSFSYWREELNSKHGFEGNGLSFEEMKKIASILRGDFHFVPSMKENIDVTKKALCALTDEQYMVLESLEENERTLVYGAAGAGKTLLAMEQARRMYWTDKRVLYVCYNKSIAGFVQYLFKKEEMDIPARTLHSILAAGESIDDPGDVYFEEILPKRFLSKKDTELYDYIIVDEGQDIFRDAYLPCLDKLLRGGLNGGSWLIFYDQNQNLFNDNNQFGESLRRLKECGAATFKLTVNCRNTKQIADANTLITGFVNTGRPKVEGVKVEYISYDSKSEEHQILEDVLTKLKDENVNGNEVILLSKYSIANPQNCLYDAPINNEIWKLKNDGRIWMNNKGEVSFATISSFKGLEADAVILFDVDDFSRQSTRLLNYVAISRACALLFILYDSSKENERQDMMIRSPQFM